MSEILSQTELILASVALVAGMVDAVVGGGGLLTVPALLMCGVPPHNALATNKFQSCFGTCMATYHYHKAGLFQWRDVLSGILFTAIGAAIGASSVMYVDAEHLKKIIPFLLAVIFLRTLLFPELGLKETSARMQKNTFFVIFGLCLGFYDGFFGPGTGALWTVILMIFLGLNIKNATGHTKVFNVTSNLVSLAIFLSFGQVYFKIGIVMAFMQLFGATIGAKFMMKTSPKVVRVLFLCMMAIMMLKLFTDQWTAAG